MGKFTALRKDIFAIFDSPGWKDENVKTFPATFIAVSPGNEFIRVDVIASGSGVNRNSVSGILSIDIYIPAGFGPSKADIIADKLDKYLCSRSVGLTSGGVTQFGVSAMSPRGNDRDNPSLTRFLYEVSFNYFGVTY